MANRTDPLAQAIHGTNPQNLVEKILRMKIYNTTYWKEHCFGLTSASVVEKAALLRYIGGTYGGGRKPTEFMCLTLKLLQLQPDKEIVVEYIKNEDYKYVRLLGAFYLRLVGRPIEVYQYLEPLYNDSRKVRLRTAEGNFEQSHVDEVIDKLIVGDYMFDISLPHIPTRWMLEQTNPNLGPWISALDEQFDEEAIAQEADLVAARAAALEDEMAREAAAARDRERDRDHEYDREQRDRGRSASPSDRRHRDRHHDDRDDRHRERDNERERARDADRAEREQRRERERERRMGIRPSDQEPDLPRERERDRQFDARPREDRPVRDKPRDKDRERDRDRSRLPPPPARERRGGKDGEGISVEATNDMRAELGLKPLK